MGEDDDGMKRYLAHCGISSELEVSYASSEIDLFEQFIRLVRRYIIRDLEHTASGNYKGEIFTAKARHCSLHLVAYL